MIEEKGINITELEEYFLLPKKGCEITSRECIDKDGSKQNCEGSKCFDCKTDEITGSDRLKMLIPFEDDQDVLHVLNGNKARYIVFNKEKDNLLNLMKESLQSKNCNVLIEKIEKLKIGMDFIHSNQIYHMNIKVDNIIVLNDDSLRFINYGSLIYQDNDNNFIGELKIQPYYPTFLKYLSNESIYNFNLIEICDIFHSIRVNLYYLKEIFRLEGINDLENKFLILRFQVF